MVFRCDYIAFSVDEQPKRGEEIVILEAFLGRRHHFARRAAMLMTLVRFSVILLATPSLGLSISTARARLRHIRQCTDNIRKHLGYQFILTATGRVLHEEVGMPSVGANTEPMAQTQVAPARHPPVQGLLSDAMPPSDLIWQWGWEWKQAAQAQELPISTSPLKDEEQPSPPLPAKHGRAITRAPPVQALLKDDQSSAWLAQFARTQELTIRTSPLCTNRPVEPSKWMTSPPEHVGVTVTTGGRASSDWLTQVARTRELMLQASPRSTRHGNDPRPVDRMLSPDDDGIMLAGHAKAWQARKRYGRRL